MILFIIYSPHVGKLQIKDSLILSQYQPFHKVIIPHVPFHALSFPFHSPFTIHGKRGEKPETRLIENYYLYISQIFQWFYLKNTRPPRQHPIFIPPKSFKRNQNRLYLHHY